MNRTVKFLVSIVILGAMSFFAYKHFNTWKEDSLEKAVTQEQQYWKAKTGSLESEIRVLQQELDAVKSPT